MQLPAYTNLKSGIKVELDYMHSHETEDVIKLLNRIILEGKSYPQQQPLTELEFKTYWLAGDSFVVKAVNTSNQSPSPEIQSLLFISNQTFLGSAAIFATLVLLYNHKCRVRELGDLWVKLCLE